MHSRISFLYTKYRGANYIKTVLAFTAEKSCKKKENLLSEKRTPTFLHRSKQSLLAEYICIFFHKQILIILTALSFYLDNSEKLTYLDVIITIIIRKIGLRKNVKCLSGARIKGDIGQFLQLHIPSRKQLYSRN